MRRRETPNTRALRIAKGRVFLRALKRSVPDAKMALQYSTPWELMVAVQLSAQCTDKKVNEVTPKLFAHYRTLDDYASADAEEFSAYIYQTGFYRAKTKNILAAAKMLKDRFDGKLPRTMREMIEIPGVARKTANVVLGNAYGVVEGIAVDTHVKRLARLYGLTDEERPEKIERDLMEMFPRKEWFMLTYYLIEYGRKYCPARAHEGTKCPILHSGGRFKRSAR